MITLNNYYEQIKSIDLSSLPATLKAGHEFVDEATGKGSSWSEYHADPEIKEVIDLYFEKVDAFLSGKQKGAAKPTKPKTKVKARSAPARTKKAAPAKKSNASKPKAVKKKTASKPKTAPGRTAKVKVKAGEQGKPVAAVREEVAIIKRCINMHEKVKTKQQVLLFVNALERKILEKKIRKFSPYAKQIEFIQQWMIDLYNKMGESVKIMINDERLEELRRISGSEKLRLSVTYIKRYVGLHGKIVTKEQVKRLHNAIATAVNKGKIKKSDPYYDKLEKVIQSLRDFNCAVPSQALKIHQATLNGLQGILDGCGCSELDGLEGDVIPRNTIMSSTDIVALQFDKIGFMGKWLELIGDPSPGFTAMIFGRPKMGKSYMAVDFAGYLARNHGSVLYVAREEGIDDTLQKKLKDKDVAHPDLFVSDYLPNDLSDYDFIFFDSVNKLKLTPDDLDELRRTYPKKSFIFIFQTTKAGSFRGSNDYMHDVDVVIEVPEKGLAVQNGRFNQGGEMEIF
jgi:hypothetical protein